MRRAASQQDRYGRVLVPLTDKWADEYYGATAAELRQACGFTEKDIAWICAIYRDGVERPFVELGVVGPSFPYGGKSPSFKMAGVRAERAALRATFSLPFGDVANGDTSQADVVDGEVIVSPSTSVEPPAQPGSTDAEVELERPAFGEFVARVLGEIPYFRHRMHVEATMTKLGLTWTPQSEEAVIYALNAHANQRADEKAAAQAQAPEGAML